MTAKALGHGAQVPLIAIPTLHWFAPSSDGPFAVLLDAKVSGAYYLLGERKEAITTYHGIPAVAELAALGEILVPTSTLLTPNAAQLKPKVDALFPYNRWQWVECSIDPAHVACRVIDKFNRQELITDGNLELLYLRNMYAQKESL
jgi:tRNA A37 threonylcarbamoyladenosine modification protein TsaB